MDQSQEAAAAAGDDDDAVGDVVGAAALNLEVALKVRHRPQGQHGNQCCVLLTESC
jgi:hypothetical protein